MNHLVFLDDRAGELEKILSGVKSMVIKEFDPAIIPTHPVRPGDHLYFLRNKDECGLRVKATVVRVLYITGWGDAELSQTLKELQPRLQLTEDQYSYWSAQKQAVLVEFDSAHKIGVLHVAPEKIANQSGWMAFEEFSRIV